MRDTVLQEYHHLLDVFEKGEITTVPPHRTGIELGIDLEEGKTVPKKKYTPSVTTNWKNFINPSKKTRTADGFEG